MKLNILIPLFTFAFGLRLLHAAVPLRWTVETTRVQPAVFDVVRGESIDLEAVFNNAGKPFAMDGHPCSIFWQTNGMGTAWWSAPATVKSENSDVHLHLSPSNVVCATFTPAMDPGASTVIGFLGSTGQIYRAAFQLRFRHGPGAIPNALPLPVPVIDFAKVRVLNPPWSGGGGGSGVDTNAVRDIVREQLATNGIRSVDGAARPLPKYLHERSFDSSYPDEAQEYYRSRGNGKADGGCSSVRDGGFLYRNFDYPFDDRAEFVVKMSAGPNRFASVGVAQVGTNLTEQMVTSGKPEFSHLYKWLPGATVDGINENGVVAEINVVDGDPQTSGWHTGGDIHPLAAVRWALDNGTSAAMVASNLAARIAFPSGWTQNFHYMIADETATYIVENGTASNITGKVVITNFPRLPPISSGMGIERYVLLVGGANITNAWFTRAYSPSTDWFTDFDNSAAIMEGAKSFWNDGRTKEQHRGETVYGEPWWQTVHTSVYDIANRTLRIAVQETDDWYAFQVPDSGGVKPEKVKEIVEPMIAEKLDKTSVDPTLTTNGVPADAKATGDVLERKVSSGSSGYLSPSFPGPAVGWGVSEYGGAGIVFGNGFNANGTIYLYDRISRDYGNKENLIPDRAGTFALDDETSLLAMLGDAAPSNLASHPTFSNACVLAVGLNIDTNNGVMLTNGVLQTKGGTSITPGNVGAYTKEEVDELVEDAGKVKTVAGQEPDASGNVSLSPSMIGAASSEDVQTLNLGYQRLYSFSTGATNANISVTNYPPTAAEAEGRTHYDPNDPDLDFSTVPASMRLDEKRDGEKRTVVDTRDWPVWYFGCKLPRILAAAQEYAHTAYTNALAHLSAWADRTARGLENPAGESTLVIDVPNIWLMTDQTFEKHVSGSSSCWVIRSKNAAISPNVTTNGFLELTDAFGTPYIRFNKTKATFADPPASGIYHDDQEGEWIITYETNTKPKGGANLAIQGSETYPGKAILKEEGDELCPAVITWTGSSGHWLMHAKPKQIAGADQDKMFFGAVVEVEGQDYIEYLKPVSFSHLVMPNGKKIAPDVPASASVGTIVNWKVVQ